MSEQSSQLRAFVPPLKRSAPYLAAFAGFAAISFVVINAAMWLVPSWAEIPARGMSLVAKDPMTLSLDVRLAALAVSSLHLALLAVALIAVRRLYLRYARGEMLHIATADCLRRCSVALLAFGVLTPVVRTLITLLVTLHNPSGQRIVAIGFSANEFIVALTGALLVMIAWVIAEAARISEDHQQIV